MSMAIPVEERLLPELRALNVAIPRVNQAKDPIGTRHAIAAAAAASASRFVPPTDVTVRQIRIPSGRGHERDIRTLVVSPTGVTTTPSALIWFTEGAGIFGAPEANLPLLCKVTSALGITCISGAYALAPEHPWPAAYDDASLVWDYVTSESGAEALGISGDAALALGGTSFGGMLAAKLSQALAADQTLCQPRGVILDSASVAEPEQESPVKLQELERHHIVTHANTHECTEVVRIPSGVWPASASDDVLSKLPPHFIGCAELDVLQPPVLAYAHRLLILGVPLGLRLERGTFHCWTTFTPGLPVTEAMHDAYVNFLRSVL